MWINNVEGLIENIALLIENMALLNAQQRDVTRVKRPIVHIRGLCG